MNMNIHDVVFSLVPLRSGSSISGQEEEGIRKKQLPQTSNKMMIITSTDFGQQQANHQQQHQQQQQQYTATTSHRNGSQHDMDEFRIKVECTVSNSNSNTASHIPGKKRKNTAAALAS